MKEIKKAKMSQIVGGISFYYFYLGMLNGKFCLVLYEK